MKFLYTLFVMAVIGSSPVHASDHEVLVTENESGGYIILTDVDCPIEEMSGSNISVTTFGENSVYGCWFLFENVIYVAWVSPEGIHRTQYDPDIFRLEKVL